MTGTNTAGKESVGGKKSLKWMLAAGVGLLAGVGALSQWPGGSHPAMAAPASAGRGAAASDANIEAGIPIHFTLETAKYITLVIEDGSGHRIRNLIAETRFPAGENMILWDGYDDNGKRVEPGSYSLRGLTHDGIRLYYEFAFNTAGNPPWQTKDHTGAWMADHALPNTAVFMPRNSTPYAKGVAQMFLGSIVCESGNPTIFTDLSGQRVYGAHYFDWFGTSAGARDVGPKPRQNYFIYMLIGFEGNNLSIRAVAPDGSTKGDVAKINVKKDLPREPAQIGLSLAIYNSIAAVGTPLDNEIKFIDLTNGSLVGTIEGNSPKGLAYDKNGDLFAIVDNKIHRYQLKGVAGKVTVSNDKVLVDSGIEAGYGLTLDSIGRIYITDQGKSHQVKVFTANGGLLRTIGNPGGLQLGVYDQERMQSPEGLAVDDKGQVWVSEFDAYPKRVSIWDANTGKFIKGLYGPPAYGGGGTLDPDDPTRIFHSQYGGLTQWKVDWEKGEASLYSIPVRRVLQGTPAEVARWHLNIPERPMTINGRTYLVSGYNGGLRNEDNLPIFQLDDKTQIAWPVSYVGTVRRWAGDIDFTKHPLRDVMDMYTKAEPQTLQDDFLIAWADTNHNHKMELNEWSFRSFPEYSVMREGRMQRLNRKEVNQTLEDMSLVTRWGLHINAPQYDAQGIPIYDLKTAKAQIPPTPDMGGTEEGYGFFTTPSGKLLKGFFDQVDSDGKTIWSYPAQWEQGIPSHPGEIIEPTRLLGPIVEAKVGEAGEWYAVNGERGDIFLMTTDGLYIQTLGGHISKSPLLGYPTAKRGMLIDSPESHISFNDEHFHPTITQVTKDGKIYLSAGKEFSAIFRVDGFETIKRMQPTSLTVTSEQLAKIPATRPVLTNKEFTDKLPVLISSNPVKLDGKLDEWPATTTWAPLGSTVSVGMITRDDMLYLGYKTGDPNAIDNDGSNYQFMFKTGGAFDIQWRYASQEAGQRELQGYDRRLLISNRKGKISAALFYPVPASQAKPPAGAVQYESPIGKVYFVKVEDVSSKVKVVGDGTGNFEVAIPQTLMQLKPESGMEILGDVGMIRGDGIRNIQRTYWHNRDTAMVSDVPTEARMVPINWGRFRFLTESDAAREAAKAREGANQR